MSLSLRILYILDNLGKLFVTCMQLPKCFNHIQEHTYRHAKTIHSTNFAHGMNYIFISVGKKVHCFTSTVKFVATYDFNSPITLVSSDPSGKIYFVLKPNGMPMVIIQSDRKFEKIKVFNHLDSLDLEVVSLSATTNWVSIMIRNRIDRSVMIKLLKNHEMVTNISQNIDQETVYQCGIVDDLHGILLVEERPQQQHFLCKVSPDLCLIYGNDKEVCSTEVSKKSIKYSNYFNRFNFI